jgi:hypothetical protein
MTGRGGPWRGPLGGRSGGTGWLAVGFEQRPMVRGGVPRSGNAQGGGNVEEQGTTLHGNCEQGCEREESRVSFSDTSSARIRRRSRGGGDDHGVRWSQRCPRGVVWRAL